MNVTRCGDHFKTEADNGTRWEQTWSGCRDEPVNWREEGTSETFSGNPGYSDGGLGSVVRESEFKSEDPEFDPLTAQGERVFSVSPSQLLCIPVCAWPPFVCMARTDNCAHVTDPISICRIRVDLTACGMDTRKHCTQGKTKQEKMGSVALWLLAFPGESSPNLSCIALGQSNLSWQYQQDWIWHQHPPAPRLWKEEKAAVNSLLMSVYVLHRITNSSSRIFYILIWEKSLCGHNYVRFVLGEPKALTNTHTIVESQSTTLDITSKKTTDYTEINIAERPKKWPKNKVNNLNFTHQQKTTIKENNYYASTTSIIPHTHTH